MLTHRPGVQKYLLPAPGRATITLHLGNQYSAGEFSIGANWGIFNRH
jgi:hypothetical protein